MGNLMAMGDASELLYYNISFGNPADGNTCAASSLPFLPFDERLERRYHASAGATANWIEIMAKLTKDVLASYLAEMPPGHIFDLPNEQFAGLFPPGEPDPFARAALRAFANGCGCDLVQIVAEGRYELRKRA